MTYYTALKEASINYEEKKSLFIGHIKRIENESEAKEYINRINERYKDANHNVFAYIIGRNMEIQRYSDDGEPQGTAGIPVLEVIKKHNITNVVLVVTRFFGGILLGSGGLIRAYSKTASLAIQEAEILEIVNGKTINISLDYDLLGKIQYLCSKNNWHIERVEYYDIASLTIFTTTNNFEEIYNSIIEYTNGRCSIEVGPLQEFFKYNNKLFTHM